MTVIAAVARHGQVTMGADTANLINGRHVFGTAKIAKIRIPALGYLNGFLVDLGDLPSTGLVGVTGDGALLPLAVGLDLIAGDVDTLGHRAAVQLTKAATSIKPSLLVKADDGGEHVDGIVILAYAGRVWSLLTNQAHEHADGIVAVGAGGDLATGALHTNDPGDGDTAAMVDAAIRVACRYDPWCAIDEQGPYLLTIDGAS